MPRYCAIIDVTKNKHPLIVEKIKSINNVSAEGMRFASLISQEEEEQMLGLLGLTDAKFFSSSRLSEEIEMLSILITKSHAFVYDTNFPQSVFFICHIICEASQIQNLCANFCADVIESQELKMNKFFKKEANRSFLYQDARDDFFSIISYSSLLNLSKKFKNNSNLALGCITISALYKIIPISKQIKIGSYKNSGFHELSYEIAADLVPSLKFYKRMAMLRSISK